MKIPNSRWIWLAASLALTASHAWAACSNETLHGKYAFTITGQILAPPPVAGPVSGVAMTTFDGLGGLTQVDHVVHNGAVPVEAWRPASGSYALNANCTGWMTIVPHPSNAADGSPALNLYIVVTRDGNLVNTVVSGAPLLSVFSANITSNGTRTDSDE